MADVCCRVRPGGNAVGVPYRLGSKVEIGGSGSLDRAGPLRPPRPLPVWRVIFFLRRIFRLTRVTRIFQKSIFTRTAPRRPGGRPRRAFCCADADAPARGVFFCCKTRRETMTFHKGESGNSAGRQRGSRNRTTILMQSLLEADGEALARKAIDLAKGGDLAGFACAWTGWCRRASTSRSPSTCRGSTRRPTPSPPRRPSWPRSRPASSRRRRPPTSPRWSTSTCGRWRRRSSRSASQSSKTTPRPPACRLMPTHDSNVDGRTPTHAAAAAAVSEPAEQARESSRPRTPDFFHLEGPWGYARRHRGQARSPARRGNGAGGRQVHSHPLAAPRRKVIDQA